MLCLQSHEQYRDTQERLHRTTVLLLLYFVLLLMIRPAGPIMSVCPSYP